MKYNATFIIEDGMTEIMVETVCRGEGYKVTRDGKKLTVIGMTEMEFNWLLENANQIWPF